MRGPAAGLRRLKDLHGRGYRAVAGVDEVGRGCLAGPVVAAAVILDDAQPVRGLRDSKLLTAADRERLAQRLRERARAVGLGMADEREIDALNILRATLLAMRRALEALGVRPDYVIVDALTLPGLPIPQEGVIGGDRTCAPIAAASIVAKVHRDGLMRRLHQSWPAYGFALHKGYGTLAHLEALRKHGASPVHRLTFRGVRHPDEVLALPFPRPEIAVEES